MLQKQLATTTPACGQSAESRHYPCSALRGRTIYVLLLYLGAPAGLPFRIAWNYDREEVKPVIDKRETLRYAVMNWTPKRKRVGIAMQLGLSVLTVCAVVEKRKAVKANALIFNGKAIEIWGAKHTDLAVGVFLWFKQQNSRVGHATEVLPFAGKCSCEDSFWNIKKVLYLTNICLTWLFFKL